MSIIGTRPPLISETNFYELHHRARLAIKPGITGMWQVSGRSDITDFEEVVRLDKEYITNWNIGLDIKILFKTVMVTVYQNGYAMYQTAGRVTVFPVSSCRYEYESVMNGKTVRMEESFFDEKEWYLSLLMIGEDRIVSNSLSRDRNHKCFSYHAIAEDYGELEDKLTKIEEQVSQEQMVELLMSVLTEKQKEILKKVYWEQKTHKQIASMYGMSRSSVSDAVHKALMKISRSFDENGEPR